MNKWFKISGGVAAVAVAGLLTIGGVAYAQDAPKGGYAQGEQNGPSGFMQRGNRGGGEGRFGGDHGGRHGGPEFMDQDAMKAVVAQTLGLSVADLDAAKEAGKHLPQLAEEQGVDMETVKAAMKAEATRQVNQAVADGTITQTQADRILRRIENGRGPGHGPGPGRNRPKLDETPGASKDSDSADTSANSSQVKAPVFGGDAIFLPVVLTY